MSSELRHKYWGDIKETDFFISLIRWWGKVWAYFLPYFSDYAHSSGDTTNLFESEAAQRFTASTAVRLSERLKVQGGGRITLPHRGESILGFCLHHPRSCK